LIEFKDKSQICSYQQIYTYKDWCLFFKLQYDSVMLMDLGEETAKWLYQNNPQRAQPIPSIEPGCHVPCGIQGKIGYGMHGPYCAVCQAIMSNDIMNHLVDAQDFLRSTLL